MIRSKGEAGTGDIKEAVAAPPPGRSPAISAKKITQADSAELYQWAKQLQEHR